MALPRGAAVILRDMDMDQVPLDCIYGGDRVLLLDIGMERIVHPFDCGMIDFVQIARQLIHRVEEVAFESVHRFKGKADAMLSGMIASAAMKFDPALALIRRGPLARGMRVAAKIEAGMIALNRGLMSDPAAPFGGVKQSGIGREGGQGHGIAEFMEAKYLAVAM